MGVKITIRNLPNHGKRQLAITQTNSDMREFHVDQNDPCNPDRLYVGRVEKDTEGFIRFGITKFFKAKPNENGEVDLCFCKKMEFSEEEIHSLLNNNKENKND